MPRRYVAGSDGAAQNQLSATGSAKICSDSKRILTYRGGRAQLKADRQIGLKERPMLVPAQIKQSKFSSLRVSRAAQLNRRTIVILLAVPLAVLAIIFPLRTTSSALDSIATELTEISRSASVPRESSALMRRGNPSSPEPDTKENSVSEPSAASTSLALQPLAPQSGGTQFVVNFDDVAPFTEVGNRYPRVVFSSPNRTIVANDRWGGIPSSPPNIASPCCDLNAGLADFIITFPQPVNSLVFTVNVCDSIGTGALVDLYQNGSPTVVNQKVQCNGVFFNPVVNYSSFNDITKVVVHDVIDPAGLGYDSFSFAVPAATPTPTPTPTSTPPPAPTNLQAKPDVRSIDLQWTASPGATGYIIKRTNTPTNNTEFVRSISENNASAASDDGTLNVLTVLTTNATSFHDATASDTKTRYEYVVAAIGLAGTGPDSQKVFATPLPLGACDLDAKAPFNQGQQQLISGGEWSMYYNISPNDGLVLRDISLNGRRMAARISVPYFRLETQTGGQSSTPIRGELMPDGFSGGLHSKIVVQDTPLPGQDHSGGLFFHVVYAIDQMPATPKACLLISQDFQFFPPNSSDRNPPHWPGPCEPSQRNPDCAKFRTMIHYQFTSENSNESLKLLNIPQRHHYELVRPGKTKVPINHAGLFGDADGWLIARLRLGFDAINNPIRYETWARAIKNGVRAVAESHGCREYGPYDNFHQTYNEIVHTPPTSPGVGTESEWALSVVGAGCPECVHMHWRWGDIQDAVPFGAGVPLTFPPGGSNTQASLDVMVVKQSNGEEDPQDYYQLNEECDGYGLFLFTSQPVFWYSASSSKQEDYMFWHTAWFKKNVPNQSNVKQSLMSESVAPQVATQDGPLSINLGDVFQTGENHVQAIDISTVPSLPPLPAGYAALNNTAYNIFTHAEAAGPVSIDFGAVSIADESTFNGLRIFHLETDPFDPDAGVWVDRTVLPPDSPAPDFSTRILTSETRHLGVYVVGKLVQTVPPSSDRVNLSIASTDGPDPVMAGQILTYTITVTNTGPQTAHKVALRDELQEDVSYDSATSSQGSCKSIEDKVYCNLNTLNVGASATVTLKVLPRHIVGGNYEVRNSVIGRATEQDDDTSNDTSVISTTVSPDPNQPPTVVLTTTSAAIVSGPASVQLSATATDSDGSIAKVEFFDNGELVGTGVAAGGGIYTFTATVQPCNPSEDHHDENEDHHEAPCGTHGLVAVATDNGGRTSQSNSAVVFVNGVANVSITSPSSGLVTAPGGNLTLTATATNSSGSISEVEFFASDVSLGHAVLNGQNQYALSWTNLPVGNFKIVAVAREANDVPSRSVPVTITVGTPPAVSLVTPLEGTTFQSATNLGISAVATSTSSSVNQITKVEFYANGVLIGQGSGIVNGSFLMTWRQPADGKYALTAVATDVNGLTSTSVPVNIGVNAVPTRPGITLWFDDSLPVGATTQVDGDGESNGAWHWVTGNPVAYSGTKSHQSRNFKLVTSPANTIHSHSFDGATAKLHADLNDLLFTWVFLDINNMPREIMLEFKDPSGWEHRAYWGANVINRGVDGTGSRKYMGPLPKPGQWARLQAKAGLIGLNAVGGNDIDGMSFVLDGGRATFDYVGKAPSLYNAPEPTPFGDTVWVDGAVPTGGVATTSDDLWDWINCAVAIKCHQSILPPSGVGKFRQHLFTGAVPRLVNPGDILFTQVLLDPAFMPDQIVIQWHDGSSWHRAYWGGNYQQLGTEGTENWRYMGGLPKTLTWVRLEVPASYLGLENKYVSGMAFGFYRRTDNGQVIWGQSGQSPTATTVPPVLSAMAPVSRFFHSNFGYYYSTKSIPLNDADRQDGPKFFAHPDQAAGTVPFYRFVNADSTKREFFYSQCQTCPNPNVWKADGIAFYVYPNASTPGVVPLHLYHDSANTNHYFLTTNQSEAAGMVYDGIWAYVHVTNPLVPARPYFLAIDNANNRLNWLDSSLNETGFRVEEQLGDGTWIVRGTVGQNVTQFNIASGGGDEDELGSDLNRISPSEEPVVAGPNVNEAEPALTCCSYSNYRVFAFNDIGDSEQSNQTRPISSGGKLCRGCIHITGSGDEEAIGPAPQSDTPTIYITSPFEGQVVGKDLAIVANAFDTDGNGSLTKMEFYDGGVKLGELTGAAPYPYVWKNAPNGSHTLTVVATDGAGVTATSAPIHITVTGAPSVTLTSPASGTVVTAPGSVSLQATASDPEGSVSKVEFFQGDVKIGEDATSPYSFAWSNIQAGPYVITARVTDGAGLTATSTVVPLTVNSPPTVELTSPTNGELVTAPGTALLVANVADTDSSITKVDFYQGTTLIGTSTTFPYTYNWTNIPYSTYNITAKVTDSYSAVTTSAPVTFIVNSAPSVSITSPANQAMLSPFSNAVINVTASDPDGTISKVDFYQGTNLIGTDTTSPFSVNWNNVVPGSYVLTTQVTDNRGAITTSSAVAITTPAFFDDFNDNSLNTTKWTVLTPSSPASVSEQGQQLRITLPASTATYNGIASNANYDMRGATVQVELAQSVSQAGWVENMLKIEKDAQNYYLIDTGAGNTLFRSMVNGVNDQLIIPFDPVAHRYWRVRHDLVSNAVNFETSPDAITWTTRKTATAGFALTAVKFSLIAGAWGSGNAAPGAAIYNDLQYIASASPLPPTCTPAAGIIISEFRLRGPNGSNDEYVELYNNTDQNITVCTADGSNGWALVSSDGMTQFVLASGTVIAARSHYLAVGQGYSLGSYASGDLSSSQDIPENSGLAIFNTAYAANFSTANRFDAVGFTSSNSLYREGAGLPLLGANVGEYSFLRKLNSGVSQDTGDNVSDFTFVATNGGNYGGFVSILGAPGPENRLSPLQRNSTLPAVVIDPAVSASVAPNRVRDTTAVGPNAAFGTLTMRRKITNNTGSNVTKLRFRIIDITTLNTPGYVPGGSQSDMRVLTSPDVTVTLSSGQSLLVRGTSVETPPAQASGGGLNTTLNAGIITLAQPLAPGQSINVQFMLGVQQSGSFRFFFNVEALTQ